MFLDELMRKTIMMTKWTKYFIKPLKHQSHKMVKHTQLICWQQPTNCLSVFDHFVGLALNGLEIYLSDPSWVGQIHCNIRRRIHPGCPGSSSHRWLKMKQKKKQDIRTLISAEIYLQDLHSEKYEIGLINVDASMVTYFTANYENNICDNLIELWERECRKEEKSIKIFCGKEELHLNNASSVFHNAA